MPRMRQQIRAAGANEGCRDCLRTVRKPKGVAVAFDVRRQRELEQSRGRARTLRRLRRACTRFLFDELALLGHDVHKMVKIALSFVSAGGGIMTYDPRRNSRILLDGPDRAPARSY